MEYVRPIYDDEYYDRKQKQLEKELLNQEHTFNGQYLVLNNKFYNSHTFFGWIRCLFLLKFGYSAYSRCELRWYKDNKLHRENKPAIIARNGHIEWFLDGVRRCTNGPAKIDCHGNKYWMVGDLIHREDGPAIEYANGDKCWYINGLLHRVDGPAGELKRGSKAWFIHGQRHRENGPAIEDVNGDKEWWLNGELHREDGPAIEWSDKTQMLSMEALRTKEGRPLEPDSTGSKSLSLIHN